VAKDYAIRIQTSGECRYGVPSLISAPKDPEGGASNGWTAQWTDPAGWFVLRAGSQRRHGVSAVRAPARGPKSLKGVAVFSFKRLCREARGSADYLAIARRYHSVIIVGIPVMGPELRNEAARFVTLIDALYEHKVKLLAAADAEPAGLYPSGDGSFEFQRTVSRLEEMRSAEYLAEGHGSVT
jgi:predicted ATPase